MKIAIKAQRIFRPNKHGLFLDAQQQTKKKKKNTRINSGTTKYGS